LYRWESSNGVDQWVAIDTTDQTTQSGVLFADARWAPNGTTDPIADPEPTITSLLTSDYLDPDAPDPALYPQGMLLWNTRRSGYNVKSFQLDYFTTTATDYSRIYTGLVSGKTYVFSVWVKLNTATNLDITVNNVTTEATIAGDKQYTAADGLSTSGWKRIDHSFIADSSGQANIMLGVVNNTGQGGSYTQSAGSVNLWVVELNAEATPALPTSQQVTRSTCRACCRDWAWTLPWQPALAHS
jgi:hypothetical protein